MFFDDNILRNEKKCVSLQHRYYKEIIMIKKYCIISTLLCCTLLGVQGVSATAAPADPIMNFMPDDANTKIEIEAKTVTIYGAQGQTLEVISITGKHIQRTSIDNNAQRIELNVPKGCYILKVGSVVRKVSIH